MSDELLTLEESLRETHDYQHSTTISNKGKSAHKSSICFGKVAVFEFPIAMGDNPACREGCPIRLGDECVMNYTMDVNTYEIQKQIQGRTRRKEGLYLPVSDRACMLLMAGYTLADLVETVLDVEEAKKQRMESLRMSPFQKMHFAVRKMAHHVIDSKTMLAEAAPVHRPVRRVARSA